MRSKTFMSKINLQRGKLTVENRKSREKKRICLEVSVNSPGNPWSQSMRRNGRLWWETATESLLRTVFSSEFQTAGAEHRKARFASVVVVKG